MTDALSVAEINGLQVELLAPRTVLSLFSRDGGFGGGGANTFSGCENGLEPNQAVGPLGLGGAAGFVSNGCTSGGDIH